MSSPSELRQRVKLDMPDPDPLDDVRRTSTPHGSPTSWCSQKERVRGKYMASPSREVGTDGRPGEHLTQKITLAKALNTGLRRAMEQDPKVLIMGEDVGKLGGVFRITDGLQKDFGDERVIDTPLAESGIIGTAVGLAIRGYRPIVRDPVRRFRLPRLRPDRVRRWRRCTTAPSGKDHRCRSSSGFPSAAASARSSTTAESPEALLRAHRRPQGRLLLQPRRRLLDDPAVDRVRRPDHLPGAQAPVLLPRRATGQRLRQRQPAAAHRAGRPPRAPTPRVIAYGPMVKHRARRRRGRGRRGTAANSR